MTSPPTRQSVLPQKRQNALASMAVTMLGHAAYVGDEVMALPSSYFKAHTGSKQEWYDEATHSVLLENFPVRGAFSGMPDRPWLCLRNIVEALER